MGTRCSTARFRCAGVMLVWQHNLQQLRQRFPNAEQCLIEGARHNLINEAGHWRQPVFQRIDRALCERDTKTPGGAAPSGRSVHSG